MTPGATLYNQLRDADGVQVGGKTYVLGTTNGAQVITWGFFGGGLLVPSTNAGVFSQYDEASSISNTTIPIVSTTLSNKSYEMNKVGVYPNPTTDKITMETDEEFESVKIFDTTGKEIKSFINEKTFNISELKIGIYFLKTNTRLAS